MQDKTAVIDSKFRFILIAAKRARQLQSGAKAMIHTVSRKPTRIAQEEVRAGTVEWEMIRPGASPRAIPAPPERPATQADDTAHGTRSPMVATVVSSTPRQTLRQLADRVHDDQHPYEVLVMVVPQQPEASHKSGDASASRH